MPNELTNPDKIVTEERLAEFYQQILPYMGGMPDVLANKFNRADLYSTDEKLIGRWIDGKPLYQKVCSGTFGPFGGSWANVIAKSAVSSDIDKIVSAFCMINSDGTFSNIRAKVSGDYIQGYNTGWSGATVNVMAFKYTKTTDSAVEIGDDTDYSTTEKIVGTWFGKPVYQKTFNVTDISNTKNIDISDLSIDTVVNISGIAIGSTTGYGAGSYPITAIVANSSATVNGFVAVINTNNTNLKCCIGGNGLGTSVTSMAVTIKYTKTS